MGSFDRKYVNYLKTVSKKPLVSLDSFDVEGEMDSVVSNNMVGAYTVTNYLFEMGHRKIGFVGTRLATASIDDRYFGYLKSLMEHGIELKLSGYDTHAGIVFRVLNFPCERIFASLVFSFGTSGRDISVKILVRSWFILRASEKEPFLLPPWQGHICFCTPQKVPAS